MKQELNFCGLVTIRHVISAALADLSGPSTAACSGSLLDKQSVVPWDKVETIISLLSLPGV
jgi:hypothetical protein